MLFDLKGRRRRVVQGTYLMLAMLMGGGLVLFGIGGGTSGGLLDAFKGGGGSSNGNSLVEKRIAADEKRLAANPRDEAAMKELVRDNYQLASAGADPNTGVFSTDGKARLAKSDRAWTRYVALPPKKVDDSLAGVMVQAYSPFGLNQPAKAAQAAELVANARPSPAAYIQLTQYAALAHQTRKAELAGQKAVQLAPKSERSSVTAQVAQAKTAGTTKPGQGGSGTSGP